MTITPSAEIPVIRYPLDPEHWKLRAAVFGAFFVTALVVMLVSSVLFPSPGLNLLGVVAALVLGYFGSALAERLLKGRWHSARALVMDAQGLRIVNGKTAEQEVTYATAVTPLRWKFRISRRARVPKGWWMYACSLTGADKQLTVYTFMSPKDAEAFARDGQFVRLLSKKEREKAGEAPQSLRQAGEERRLREAEEHRWLAGGEMAPADFMSFLDRMDRRFEEWTPIVS
jgi:hypothetical protein